MDEVQKNKVLVETIRREHRLTRLNEHFHLNPRRLEVIAEKPSRREKRFLEKSIMAERIRKDGAADAEQSSGNFDETVTSTFDEVEDAKRKIHTSMCTPVERFSAPQTTSHEYGWFHTPLMENQTRRAKNKCSETKYAEAVLQTQVQRGK